MKDKTKEMIERVRRLLLDKDGISYSDDTSCLKEGNRRYWKGINDVCFLNYKCG